MEKEYIVELREEEADELMDEHWVSEVVKCKDCRHYDGNGTCMKKGLAFLRNDWFCADGERR